MSNVRCVNFYDLCRVCTTSSEQRTNVFSAEGKRKNLCGKLLECLSLKMDEKDRLPKTLCMQCLQNVESIFEFRTVCKNSQAMLNNCLNTANLQNGGKALVKDITTWNGKSVSVVGNSNPSVISVPSAAPQLSTVTLQAPPTTTATVHGTDLISSIMQAVGMQRTESTLVENPVLQQYTITVDNTAPKTEALTNAASAEVTQQPQQHLHQSQQHHQQQQQQPQQQNHHHSTEKDSKHNALEEFLRMKPNIKVTPLGKKNTQKQPPQQQHIPTQQIAPTVNKQETQPQLQQQQITQDQLQQLHQQIQQQIQQQWQQQQLQHQLQQLTSQLQPQQITITAPIASNDSLSPSKSKKPKLNFVLTSPTSQTISTKIPQQPQIHLQLQPTPSPLPQSTATLLSNLAPLLQQQLPQGIPQQTTSMLSPNKCFLPVTIKDENSDQQIVAHIDAKNFLLPTTYQLQMKLQPQLATVDGQPVVQLTPTSIPATLQISPQTLTNQPFQQTTLHTNNSIPQLVPQATHVAQQIHQESGNTVQITSHQIIKRDTAMSNIGTNDVATSTSDQIEDPPTSDSGGGYKQFKSVSRQKYTISDQPGGQTIEIMPTTNFTQQIMQQVQQQQKQKQQQKQQLQQQQQQMPQITTQPASNTVQRLNVTKISPPKTQQMAQTRSQQPKLPVLNKQNITISRVTTQGQQQQQHHQQLQETQVKGQSYKEQSSELPQSRQESNTAQAQTLNSMKQNPQQAPRASPIKKAVRRPPKQEATQITDHTATETSKPQAVVSQPPPLSKITAQGTASTLTTVSSVQSLPQENQNLLRCEHCGRPFKKKEHLTQHVKLHAGLRPFKCSEDGCGSAFSRKEHLLRHLVSHSGRKMFNCDVCQKPFSRKDNLNKHRRIHAGQSNTSIYTCEICNKTFALKVYYEEHMQTHEKPEAAGSADKHATLNAPQETNVKHQSTPAQLNTSQQQHRKPQEVHIVNQQTIPATPQSQQQIVHLQLPSVVNSRDLAGSTITITPSNTSHLKTLTNHDATVLNLPSSIGNFVQVSSGQFVNTSTGQFIKIEK